MMNDILKSRLEGKRQELRKFKESYLIDITNIDNPLYEQNAINRLMVMM